MKKLEGLRVLIVDDEPGIRSILKLELELEGANIFEAKDGLEGFKVVEDHKPDIVLSDYRMPNSNGLDLLLKLKSLNPFLPSFIFITGFADISEEDAYNFGADAIFGKPFDIDEIIKKIVDLKRTFRERFQVPVTISGPKVQIRLKLSGLTESSNANLLNIGRGGMFISTEMTPPVGTTFHFEIAFNDGHYSPLIGSAVVRWVRTKKSDQNNSGFGAEFKELNDKSTENFMEFLKACKPIPYIPKGA